jgi:hypothetical protein
MCHRDILMDLSWNKHTWLLYWLWRSHCGQYACYITVSDGLLLSHACIATFRLVDRCVQRLFASRNTPLVRQCCIQLFALPSLPPAACSGKVGWRFPAWWGARMGRQACVQLLRWSAAQPYLAEQHLCLQLALSLLVHACMHSPIYPHTHSLVWPHLIGRSCHSMFRAAAAVKWLRGQQQQEGVEV